LARSRALPSLALTHPLLKESAMTNRFHQLAAAAALLAGTTLAFAQSATQSIEVRGTAPLRTDVRTLCPSIDSELPDALARVARDVGQAATVAVRFQIDGSRIDTVESDGGPRAYRKAVRQAVSGLECNNAGAGRQTVQFRVRFIDPYAARGQNPVAVLNPILSEGAPR
jgi:hypothetical protein